MTQATGYIGFGRVGHERMGEKTHAFEHASYFLMLPLRDMARRGIESLALNRFAPLSFYDEDHGDAIPIIRIIRNFVMFLPLKGH